MRDIQNKIWSGVTITTTEDSDVQGNVYDTGLDGGIDISTGEAIDAVISIDTAAAVAGTETYEFKVVQSSDPDLSAGTPVTLASVAFTTAQATTLLAAGKLVVVPIPPNSITKRYLGLTLITANSASIKVTAYFAARSGIGIHKYPASAYTVLSAPQA